MSKNVKEYINFKLDKREVLACDTVFAVSQYEDHIFKKGDVVTAHYQLAVAVAVPNDISYNETSAYLTNVENVFRALIMVYGEKIAFGNLLNDKLKELLPDVKCKLSMMEKWSESYVCAGRGGRIKYATEHIDLLNPHRNDYPLEEYGIIV